MYITSVKNGLETMFSKWLERRGHMDAGSHSRPPLGEAIQTITTEREEPIFSRDEPPIGYPTLSAHAYEQH